MQKICFIINPLSGARTSIRTLVHLIQENVTIAGRECAVVYIQGPGDGSRLSREAVAQGFDLVVAVGGDGTVNAVAQGLLNAPAVLAVIPAGSGNGFARSLGIPLDQRDALRLLLAPKSIAMDAGTINGRYFFNMAGIGLDAAISKSFEQYSRRGIGTYFLAGIKTYFAFKVDPVTLHYAGRTAAFEPLVLSIANGPQYGSGAIIAPRAQVDDGMLDMCILEKLPAWRAAANVYRLFNGTVARMKGYSSFQTSALIIERPGPGLIHVDGEPCVEEARLQIEVVPGKLRVAAGENAAARSAGFGEARDKSRR
jgi:diacylglycerol kinase (ATP)